MTHPSAPPARPARQAAFTLVEILIGVLVFSGVLAATYTCLEAGLKSRDASTGRADALQRARVALGLITRDLRHACRLGDDLELIGFDREIDAADGETQEADNLDFATHNWTPRRPGEGDICEVSYYIDRSRTTGKPALWRRRDPTPDREPLEGGLREEILDEVAGFRLEYYDGFEWFDEWGEVRQRVQEDTERSRLRTNISGLPDAVRITLLLPLDADGAPAPGAARPRAPRRAAPETAAPVALGPGGAAPPGSTGRERAAAPSTSTRQLLTLERVVYLPLAEMARRASYSTTSSAADGAGDGSSPNAAESANGDGGGDGDGGSG